MIDLAALAHPGLTFNAPLGEARAAALVERLTAAAQPSSVLDLGCGWGELLLRLCAATGARGDGVDTSAPALDRGRRLARERGLADRVAFHEAEAAGWEGTADVVLAVAAAHAWGGAGDALGALRAHVAPGGRVLFADGVWEREPSEEARAIFGDLPDLAGLCDLAAAAGLRVLHHATSGQDEWDDFESDWRRGLELSDDPEARALADERRAEYLRVYRGVAGHAWLVLAPA